MILLRNKLYVTPVCLATGGYGNKVSLHNIGDGRLTLTVPKSQLECLTNTDNASLSGYLGTLGK